MSPNMQTCDTLQLLACGAMSLVVASHSCCRSLTLLVQAATGGIQVAGSAVGAAVGGAAGVVADAANAARNITLAVVGDAAEVRQRLVDDGWVELAPACSQLLDGRDLVGSSLVHPLPPSTMLLRDLCDTPPPSQVQVAAAVQRLIQTGQTIGQVISNTGRRLAGEQPVQPFRCTASLVLGSSACYGNCQARLPLYLACVGTAVADSVSLCCPSVVP